VWRISEPVWWNSVEQHGGTVEQCGTVWWNSVEQYGARVWNTSSETQEADSGGEGKSKQAEK